MSRLKQFLHTHGLLILILLVAIAVRVWQFGSVPPGLNQDEASTAYDAFAILHYGIDRNGISLPIVLISWGSGMNALPAYVLMPFIGMFGLHVWSFRLAHLVIHCCSLIIWYLLVKRLQGNSAALIALFLLAINPWHIMVSRWGLDENLFPPIFLLGIYFLATADKKVWKLNLSALFFGLCLYTHGASYFTVPVFLLIAAALLLWKKQISFKRMIPGMVIFALLTIPHALFFYLNHADLPTIATPFFSIPRLTGVPRYMTVSSLFGGHALQGIWESGANFVHFLLVQQDGMIWSTMPNFGFLYLWSMPVAIVGLLVAMRGKIQKGHSDTLMLVWLLVSVLLALILPVNVNRMNIIILPLIYFSARTISLFQWSRAITAFILVLYVCSFTQFTYAYFTKYPAMIGPPFVTGFPEAMEFAVHNTRGSICVTDQVNMPYIYALFADQTNPHEFIRTEHIVNPGAEFQSVSHFTRFTFGLTQCGQEQEEYVVRQGEMASVHMHASGTTIRQFGDFAVMVRESGK